jgi:hypothetical protein
MDTSERLDRLEAAVRDLIVMTVFDRTPGGTYVDPRLGAAAERLAALHSELSGK